LKIIRKRPRRLFVTAMSAAALWLLAWYAFPWLVTLPPGLPGDPPASTVFLDRDGKVIDRLPMADSTRAKPISFEEIPADLIASTLAAEDKRFFKHGGVDLIATVRAAKDLVVKRRIVSGASTITQQLIKISSPPAPRRPWTKVREALAARRLEMSASKQEIITAYLNRLDYGNLRIGSAEASAFYYQKPLRELSLGECAMLAGLPQAPSWHNPLKHPKRAVARRDVVLERLSKFPDADETRISRAMSEPLLLRPLRETRSAPWLASTTIPQGRIKTTIDLSLQRDLETIVREETAKHRLANLRHAAAIIIHNPTGEILALVSSADWNDPRGGQINGASAPRSPGSALKPFTYLLAISKNQHGPTSIIADIPSPFRTPQGVGLPENYDRTFRGPVTLRSALACSLNVPALRELNSLGGPALLHELLLDLGITTLGEDPEHHGLGLTLGNAPVRLIELTNAYATLARGGRHFPAHWIRPTDAPEPVTLFETKHAWLISHILSDSAARAPAFPPGGPLDLPFQCAVKTGTSSDFRDNWCLGYTPEFTVGVWAGNFESQPMKGISGIAGAGPIFQRAMLRLHRKHAPAAFIRPDEVVDIAIDSRTGKRLTDSSDKPHLKKDIALADTLPPPAVAADYEPSGKVLLDSTYAAWFNSPHNQRRGEFTLDDKIAAAQTLRVITPVDKSTFLLDPEIPGGTTKLRPVTNMPGHVRWTSETLRIEPSLPEPVIHLVPGTHLLTATDPRTGDSRELTLYVKPL